MTLIIGHSENVYAYSCYTRTALQSRTIGGGGEMAVMDNETN